MTSAGGGLRAFAAGDGDLRQLTGRVIAFIGYGNQGRAQALNLRDSLRAAAVDCDLIVATLRDRTWAQAEADGFAVRAVADAVGAAGVILLLVPDEALAQLFPAEIAPALKPNDALVFASGYNLAFGEIAPPDDVDLLLLAPRMIGRQMRRLFERGDGFCSYVSVERDASGRAWPTLLALAKGIGTLAASGGAAFELSARDEAVLDLFHEQGFGAILGASIFLSLEVGQQAGLPPEALVLDFYLSGEMAQTFQTMAELGFVEQARLHSLTSQYGGMTRTMELDREPLRQHLLRVIEEIKSGEFARRWAAERASNYEGFKRLRALAGRANPFSASEERLRAAVREAQARAPGER